MARNWGYINRKRRPVFYGNQTPLSSEEVAEVNGNLAIVDALTRKRNGVASDRDLVILAEARRNGINPEEVRDPRQDGNGVEDRTLDSGSTIGERVEANGQNPSDIETAVLSARLDRMRAAMNGHGDYTADFYPRSEQNELGIPTTGEIFNTNGIGDGMFTNEPSEADLVNLHNETLGRYGVDEGSVSRAVSNVARFGQPSVMRERA